eukprot:jgi/Bigna1/80711/fgenesh1_pg.73_\
MATEDDSFRVLALRFIVLIQRRWRQRRTKDPESVRLAFKDFQEAEGMEQVVDSAHRLKLAAVPYIKKIKDPNFDHDSKRALMYIRDAMPGHRRCKEKRYCQQLLDRWDSQEYENYPAKGFRVLVVGGGPAGLRCAIECALLGADVTVIEKRKGFTRWNVLHIWDLIVTDLKNLGIKFSKPK